jgi:ABC-type Fe3+/spermidine/putrescine transport system ATPase subunit
MTIQARKANQGGSLLARQRDPAGAAAAAPGGDPEMLLQVGGVSRYYGESAAVDHIDLDIRRGEVFALLGASGCGKSTTLRMIAGLEPVDEGSVVMAGRTLADARTGRSLAPERRDIGIVFQSYAVWPHMSVAKNVEFPLKVRRVPRAERRERVARVLELTGLADWADRPATALSGGQQQRVALARALVYEPQLVLLDEPLSNLDAKLRRQMRREIRRLNRELGVTMLFVTHDQDEAFAVADRVGVMNGGRLEQVGSPAEMYDSPATPFVRDFLGRTFSFEGSLVRADGQAKVVLDPGVGSEITPLSDVDLDGSAEQRVRAYIRPEYVEVLPLMDTTAPNHLVGEVVAADYLGDRMEYRVKVGDSAATLTASREVPHAINDRVTVRVDPARITVWPL